MATNDVNFLLQSEPIHSCQRQAEEEADPAIQENEGVAESPPHLFMCSLHHCGIGDAPMRRHRLAGPYGTDFIRGVVANGEDKVEMRRAALVNSCQLLLRSPAVDTWADSSCPSASDRTDPVGRLPAL